MRILRILLCGLLGGFLFCGCAAPPGERAKTLLIRHLEDPELWRRIHAAEALLQAEENPPGMDAEFQSELRNSAAASPERVGILRVLAQTVPARRDAVRRELLVIADNPAAAGRIHAFETIGKLRLAVEPERAERYFEETSSTYALLVAEQNAPGTTEARLRDRARGGETTALFAFTLLNRASPETLDVLRSASDDSRLKPTARAFAFTALLRLPEGRPPEAFDELKRRIDKESDPAALRFYLAALGGFPVPEAAALCERYFDSGDAELQIAAAGAFLKQRRALPSGSDKRQEVTSPVRSATP